MKEEEITVRKFMLKKFPTNEYIDCPIPKHHWETIREYAEAYASQEKKKEAINLIYFIRGIRDLEYSTDNEVYEQYKEKQNENKNII